MIGFLKHSTLRKHFIFPYLLAVKEFLIGFSKRDFSQFGEQSVLSNIVPNIPGYYLDIGSGRPVSGNNTFFLYRRGWSGILVDPIKTNILASRIIRKRDLHFNLIVGSKGRKTFFEFFPYEYSTTSPEIAAGLSLKENVKLLSSYEIEVESADSFYSLLPSNSFVVLNIDAEGSDYEILESLNLKLNRPNIILIEEWDFSPVKKTLIGELLTQFGYRLIARAGLTSVYKNESGGGGI